MSEKAEPQAGSAQQVVPPAASPTNPKPATRPATKTKVVGDDRDDFIRNALPVAAALRRDGKPEEAKKLELVANAILQTKSMERAPASEQVQAPAKEESVKDLLASVYKAIDQNPALKNMPEAKAMRRAGDKLDKDGMLNITVRNGVVVSFVSNFTDNFSRTQQLGKAEPAPTLAVAQRAPAPGAAAQPVGPPATQVAAAPQQPAPVQQAAPRAQTYPVTDTQGSVIKPEVGSVPPIAPTPAAAVAKETPAVAFAGPAPVAVGRGEVIYSAAPPMSDGLIRRDVLSSQPAHYSVFQIQVNPQDNSRAILLPTPGADGRLVNSLRDSMDNAYHLSGRPEPGKTFLAVETPTQLERTADGWRVTEKGLVGFSATETVYQAQQPVPVQQRAPQVAQQPTAVLPFTRADVSAEELARVGVQVADLEKSGQLQKLLEGKKTDLIPFVLPNRGGVAIPFEAKLVLHRDAQGAASLRVDLPKHELEIPRQIMGKDITPAMQVQLQANGVVPLMEGFQDGKGQPFAAYLAVDKEMKRVVAVRRDGITVPPEVHGVKLSPEQRTQLLEGRPTRVEGMANSKQQLVDAIVQLDPLARKLTFRDAQPRAAQEQNQAQEPARRRSVRV